MNLEKFKKLEIGIGYLASNIEPYKYSIFLNSIDEEEIYKSIIFYKKYIDKNEINNKYLIECVKEAYRYISKTTEEMVSDFFTSSKRLCTKGSEIN